MIRFDNTSGISIICSFDIQVIKEIKRCIRFKKSFDLLRSFLKNANFIPLDRENVELSSVYKFYIF